MSANPPIQQMTTVDKPFTGGHLFDWEEGKATPKQSRAMAKEQAQSIYHAVAGMPYKGEFDEMTGQYIIKNPEYLGLTVQEVITMKAAEKALAGDSAAINAWQDRIMGKPKQAIESMTVGVTLTEYLNMLAQEEGLNAVNVPAEPVYDVMDEV